MPSSDRAGRYRIEFTEHARVKIPNVWKGDRNPVKYAMMRDPAIDPSKLEWKPMPTRTEARAAAVATRDANEGVGVGALTMAQAKAELALTFGVPSGAIEIMIRG